MWYHCPCGKVKSGQPYKNSGYRPWLCERCKAESIRKSQVPIIIEAVQKGSGLSAILVKLKRLPDTRTWRN